MNTIKTNKGFTILELLVSAGILSFIIAGMTIALQQQQRQFNISKETIDIDQTGRALLDFISSEVRNAAAMQGKTFSIEFFNGGSNFIGTDNSCNNNTTDTGTINSPPDCLAVFTWDVTRGMTVTTTPNVETTLPSAFARSQIKSIGSGLTLDLPDFWVDPSTNRFIGETQQNQQILIGARTRAKLCNQDANLANSTCINNPGNCSECSMVFRATVNESLMQITIDDIIDENLPVDFSGISEFVTGKNSAAGDNFSAFDILGTTSEITIVESKIFRVNTETRELEMNINHTTNNGNLVFQPIAGGAVDPNDTNDNSLSSPAVVDLQFVFNLRNADGSTTKVGYCDGSTCNNDGREIWSDFSEIEDNQNIFGRQNSIQSVEIYLVMKSKVRPRQLKGGFFDSQIPEIADVLEREIKEVGGSVVTTQQSDFKEPELGYLYRVFTTTVYPRNMAREEIF